MPYPFTCQTHNAKESTHGIVLTSQNDRQNARPVSYVRNSFADMQYAAPRSGGQQCMRGIHRLQLAELWTDAGGLRVRHVQLTGLAASSASHVSTSSVSSCTLCSSEAPRSVRQGDCT